MSAVFYTSDLHIGHRLVSTLRADRFMDSPDVATDDDKIAWHSDTLAQRWDATVTKDDVVIVVGDISIGGKAQHAALEWVSKRPGIKHLVAGNHDYVHPMHRDFTKWVDAYAEVFASAVPFARRKIEGHPVMVSHYPYDGDHVADDRDVQYRLRDLNVPVIHGHTHSSTPFSHSREGTAQINVAVDAWNLTPVRQSTFVDMLKD